MVAVMALMEAPAIIVAVTFPFNITIGMPVYWGFIVGR